MFKVINGKVIHLSSSERRWHEDGSQSDITVCAGFPPAAASGETGPGSEAQAIESRPTANPDISLQAAAANLQHLKHDSHSSPPRKAVLWSDSVSSSVNWDVYLTSHSLQTRSCLGSPALHSEVLIFKFFRNRFKCVLLQNSSFPLFPTVAPYQHPPYWIGYSSKYTLCS